MKQKIIGVISDTHGLMRPQALDALAGSDLIIHAGDIGAPEVLDALREIAPLHVVRGNIDQSAWSQPLPETEMFEVDGRYFYLLHNRRELDIDPVAAGVEAVVFGHSHRFCNEHQDGVLYFNPASAGPPRFSLPIAVGRIIVSEAGLQAEHIELEV